MPTLDIIILIILGLFILHGWRAGFIGGIGALLGLVAGAWGAGNYYTVIGAWLAGYMGEAVGNLVAFAVIFILIVRLTGLVFVLIDKIFKIVAIIPFLKTINRLAGTLLGFVEGTIGLGLVLYVAGRLTFSLEFSTMLLDSKMAPWLVKTATLFVELLPEALKTLESVI